MRHVFVIGAMKSGSTSLYNHLRTHPEICSSRIKEPSFFTKEALTSEEVLRYRELYSAATNEKWAFEASTNYSKYPLFQGVPARIHSMFPDAKLIYILRHPVERIYSHYIHNLAVGRERRRFEDAVLKDDQHYMNVSRYFLQLTQYLKFFSPKNILVLIFEDLIQRKLIHIQRVSSFLGIDQGFVPLNLDERKNTSAEKTIDRPVLRRLESTLMYNCLPQRGRDFLKGLLQRPAPSKLEFYDPILHNSIKELLHKDVDQLQGHLGVKITAWDF